MPDGRCAASGKADGSDPIRDPPCGLLEYGWGAATWTSGMTVPQPALRATFSRREEGKVVYCRCASFGCPVESRAARKYGAPGFRSSRCLQAIAAPARDRPIPLGAFARPIGESSNGRTTDSDSVSLGSNPSSPAKSLSSSNRALQTSRRQPMAIAYRRPGEIGRLGRALAEPSWRVIPTNTIIDL